MAPVKERVADRLAEHLCPLEKFLLVCGVSGNISLLHAAGAHKTPLVVVRAKPYLRDRFKLTVL